MELQQKIKSRFPYFKDEAIERLLGLSEIVVLNAGEVFIEAGSRSQRAALVLEGLLRNYIVSDSGEQITVVFASEMQAIAPYASIFLNKPASETTEAIENSVLLTIDHKTMTDLAGEDIIFAQVYIDMIQRALVGSIERIEDFTLKNPEQRYQRLLEVHGQLIERVPLKYLASYLGITTFSLSRIRKRLAQNRT
jgi:CRP-like cAMP-binding protein